MAVLLSSMYAIQTSKNNWESLSLIYVYLLLEISLCGSPQESKFKAPPHRIGELLHGLKRGALTNAAILIYGICRDTVGKHVYGDNILLQRGQP
jgi:hypothetical protein